MNATGDISEKVVPQAAAGSLPLLSVIVPVFNVEPYLRRALDSICSQNYPALEIICVDDGSTDGSLSILREYEAKDSRIRVLSQANAGLASARNAGLDAATGVWVAGVDPDDYLLPGAYGTAMAMASDEVDLVVFGAHVEAEADSGLELLVAGKQKYLTVSYEGVRALDEECICGHNVVFWNKLYRRSVLEEHQLRFDASLRRSEDICFHLRFCACAGKAAFCPKPFYTYVLRSGSISSANKNVERDLQDFLRSMENVVSLYMEKKLMWTHGKVLRAVVYSTVHYVRQSSFLMAQPLLWRERLIERLKHCRLHYCVAVAPILYELEEQQRAAQRAVALLRACAPPAGDAPGADTGDVLHVAIPVTETCASRVALLVQGLRPSAEEGREVCLHAMAEGLTPCTRERLEALSVAGCQVCVHEVPSSHLRHLPPLEMAFPHAGYLKMALPWLLPGVRRVLVLSPGMLVEGVLPSLDSVEMEGMPVAVLRDAPLAGRTDAALRLQLERYESCSALLMDLEMMRSQGGPEPWAAACMFTYRRHPKPEMDSFNIAFCGRMAYLPPVWQERLSPATSQELKRVALEGEASLDGLPVDEVRQRAWSQVTPTVRKPAPEREIEGIALQYRRLRRRYHYYGLMSKLTWGRRHRHYVERRRAYRAVLREIRQFFRDARSEWELRG